MPTRDDNLIIVTEDYNGPDRRSGVQRKDRRQALPISFDEHGEMITERGSVIDIRV